MKTNLETLVYSYKTKNKEGFIASEIKELLKQFPNINMEKFDDAMMGNTCMIDKDGHVINYHCDVLTALRCGVEDRDMYVYEFD